MLADQQCLLRAHFLVQSSCLVPSWQKEWESSMGSLTRALISFMRAPTSWLNHLSKATSPNTITLGIRIATYEFVGGTHSVHNTVAYSGFQDLPFDYLCHLISSFNSVSSSGIEYILSFGGKIPMSDFRLWTCLVLTNPEHRIWQQDMKLWRKAQHYWICVEHCSLALLIWLNEVIVYL